MKNRKNKTNKKKTMNTVESLHINPALKSTGRNRSFEKNLHARKL